ncbi:hypothetical protein T492DRAFT_962752, partial [Pavlovales sp. CCMP2436]
MAERLKLDMDDIRATLKLFVLVLEDDPSVLWTGGQGSGEILGWGYYELPFGLLAHVLGGDGPVAQLEENSAREKTRWGSAAGARRQRAAECADRLRRQLEQEAAEEAEWAWQCERNVAAAEEAAEKTAEEEADAQGATPPPVAAPLSRGHRRKVLRVADGDEPMTCEGAAEAVDAAAAPAADDDDEGENVLSGGARRRRKAEHARQVAALDGLAARPTADSLAESGAPRSRSGSSASGWRRWHRETCARAAASRPRMCARRPRHGATPTSSAPSPSSRRSARAQSSWQQARSTSRSPPTTSRFSRSSCSRAFSMAAASGIWRRGRSRCACPSSRARPGRGWRSASWTPRSRKSTRRALVPPRAPRAARLRSCRCCHQFRGCP